MNDRFDLVADRLVLGFQIQGGHTHRLDVMLISDHSFDASGCARTTHACEMHLGGYPRHLPPWRRSDEAR